MSNVNFKSVSQSPMTGLFCLSLRLIDLYWFWFTECRSGPKVH
ncbi:hypothetical protein DFQ01_101555 [Paenibacillus cellulosilyticus]|uniref:Uncharacterized protein n=1 Tax=Paenibacillus cellulosilyticus TaxID=375489 RepID=A0A2V2Z0C5_9BACL|nr:hypothetical protein DFQ01_101555 [Paenibacillus cellulosilyticus]